MKRLIPQVGPHSMSVLDMATGSLYLFFRLFLQFASLFFLLAVLPLLIIVLGVMTIDGTDTLGPVLVVAGLLTMYAALFYYIAAVVLAVNNYLHRVSLSFFQIGRRLRGSLLFRVFVAGFLQMAIIYLAMTPVLVPMALGPDIAYAELLSIVPVLVAAVLATFAFTSVIFVQPAVVLERLRPIAAIRRSWTLARGLRLRVTGTTVLFYLILAFFYRGLHLLHERVAPWIAEGIPELMVMAVLLPAGTTFPVLLYHDALDRQGLAAPPPEPDI